MIQNNTALLGNTTSNINILSSSQTTKVTQTPAQSQQDETKSQNTDVSAAYAVEISHEGASLHSQSSSTTTVSDLTQTASTLVKAAQNSSQSQTAETSSKQTDSSAAYSVEISQAGAELDALKSSSASDTDSTKPSMKPSAKPASSSATDSSSSTESLSQYSESQLQQMVSNGKISQSDYNNEVIKRKSAEETKVEKTSSEPTEPMGSTSDISKSA